MQEEAPGAAALARQGPVAARMRPRGAATTMDIQGELEWWVASLGRKARAVEEEAQPSSPAAFLLLVLLPA